MQRSDPKVIGLWYGVGGLALAAVGGWRAPWGLVLLWPALSLLLVATGYLATWPGVFGKRNGRLSAAARVALGPYLWSHWIWRQKDWQFSEPFHQIMPGLRLGRMLSNREAQQQIDTGVTAVLDLTCEHDETKRFRRLPGYHNIQVLDLTLPAMNVMDEAVRFVRDQMDDGEVFLHCAIGHGRSAIVATAVLMVSDESLDVDEACHHVKTLRPRAKLPPHVRHHLQCYHKHLKANESIPE